MMSVEPGFGGQSFMPETYDRVKELNEYKEKNNLDFIIEVDGGINDRNAHELVACGAQAFVAGSYVFNGDIEANIAKLRKSE